MRVNVSKVDALLDCVVKYAALPLLAIGVYVLVTGFENPFAAGIPRWPVLLSIGLLAINVFYLLGILFLAGFFYRPWKAVSDRDLPSCTVIVPAYNEGQIIRRKSSKSLRSTTAAPMTPGAGSVVPPRLRRAGSALSGCPRIAANAMLFTAASVLPGWM